MIRFDEVLLAVHTSGYATELVKILSSHGIVVRLKPDPSFNQIDAVAIYVSRNQISAAIRISESGILASGDKIAENITGMGRQLLIPVDFTPSSILACRLGFALAVRLSLHPVLLNVYSIPFPEFDTSFFSVGDSDDDLEQSDLLSGEQRETRRRSVRMMYDLRRNIIDMQKSGLIADVGFDALVAPGVAEDVIRYFSRTRHPEIIVMSTRGRQQREVALVGSVTAEVIDSCRVPVFTVPDNMQYSDIESIKKLVFFCNLDRQDVLSIGMLMSLFGFPEIDVTLIPVNDRDPVSVSAKLDSLCGYLQRYYPMARFESRILPSGEFRREFEKFLVSSSTQLLIVPNKKKNIFSRLFKPGIAHKLLFERDLPMLALPV